MYFWNILLFLLSFWIPGMADFLKDCKPWQQEFFGFPTYNCSIPENSTIRLPMMPKNLTYVFWRANSSSAEVPVLLFDNGAQHLLSSKFKNCAFSDGYLNLCNLKERQQGVYEVKEKEAIKVCIYVSILPDHQRKRNLAASAASTLPTSYLVLCCVLLVLWEYLRQA